MEDITTLYDDLVAIRRTVDVLPDTASGETRRDLERLLEHVGNRFSEGLRAMPVEERRDILYELDIEYGSNPYGRGVWTT